MERKPLKVESEGDYIVVALPDTVLRVRYYMEPLIEPSHRPGRLFRNIELGIAVLLTASRQIQQSPSAG